jgi:hypothetical protein
MNYYSIYKLTYTERVLFHLHAYIFTVSDGVCVCVCVCVCACVCGPFMQNKEVFCHAQEAITARSL